uniref:Anthranilate synthase component 2 n=1 Tax=Balbiania investiens TaxID=111861 RepID=A0A4D6BKZ8_9FLOR|nr:anthranilate synthase component II [Balbiania investiens]QBX88531.1 anthranilate synthase component II [Balbiania investiens]
MRKLALPSLEYLINYWLLIKQTLYFKIRNHMILIIDNYDSFTYNLVQYIGTMGFKVEVLRNDAINLQVIKHLEPSHIIISPGPGYPDNSGISLHLIKYFAKNIPILGVCLGHQSIGHIYGAKIIHAPFPIHGKVSLIYHDGRGLFFDLKNPFAATRYHSLIIGQLNLPRELTITAWTSEGIIMGCQNSIYPKLYGIQFHPESLWTLEGRKLLSNFLAQK